MRQEGAAHQAKLREMLPLANASRAASLTVTALGSPGDAAGWGRVLVDAEGSGVVVVHGIEADGKRAFCWRLGPDGKRDPLAAIDLADGSGFSSIRVSPRRTGSFLITLEEPDGEPSENSPAVIEEAVD